jgi:hypothetical protein
MGSLPGGSPEAVEAPAARPGRAGRRPAAAGTPWSTRRARRLDGVPAPCAGRRSRPRRRRAAARPGQAGGERRGQRAAGAVGGAGLEPGVGKRCSVARRTAGRPLRPTLGVAALDQHRGAAAGERLAGPAALLLRLVAGAGRQAGEAFELGQVGGHHVASGRSSETSASTASSASSGSPLLATITGSRTTARRRRERRGQPAGHGADDAGVGQHADLHRVDAEVAEHGVDLRRHHLRRQLVDGAHPQSVLGGDAVTALIP